MTVFKIFREKKQCEFFIVNLKSRHTPWNELVKKFTLLISLQASGLTFLKNEIPHTYFWRLLRYNPWEEVLIQHPRAVLQQLLCSCNWKPWKIATIREKISVHFNNVTGCKYFSVHVFFNAFHQKCWTAMLSNRLLQ